jgi:hypothetical protein
MVPRNLLTAKPHREPRTVSLLQQKKQSVEGKPERCLIIGSVCGAIGDQLVRIHVTGTIRDVRGLLAKSFPPPSSPRVSEPRLAA